MFQQQHSIYSYNLLQGNPSLQFVVLHFSHPGPTNPLCIFKHTVELGSLTFLLRLAHFMLAALEPVHLLKETLSQAIIAVMSQNRSLPFVSPI